jgi:hypothetical protein
MSEPRDTLAELRAHGFPVSAIPLEQLEVLCSLSDTEFELLLDIKMRLDEAAPEVQAHSEIAGAALF